MENTDGLQVMYASGGTGGKGLQVSALDMEFLRSVREGRHLSAVKNYS